jgi:hypothetical protein
MLAHSGVISVYEDIAHPPTKLGMIKIWKNQFADSPKT